MQARRNDIVRVVDGHTDAMGINRGRHQETANRRPLPPGHYFVLWPARARSAQFGRSMRYFGPFVRRAQAEILRTSALYLGIVRGNSAERISAGRGAPMPQTPPMPQTHFPMRQGAASRPACVAPEGAAAADPLP